jgi:hypothetical protein
MFTHTDFTICFAHIMKTFPLLFLHSYHPSWWSYPETGKPTSYSHSTSLRSILILSSNLYQCQKWSLSFNFSGSFYMLIHSDLTRYTLQPSHPPPPIPDPFISIIGKTVKLISLCTNINIRLDSILRHPRPVNALCFRDKRLLNLVSLIWPGNPISIFNLKKKINVFWYITSCSPLSQPTFALLSR